LIRRLGTLSLRSRLTIGSTAIAAVVIILLVVVMRLQVVIVVANTTKTLLDADADPYVAALEVDSSPNLRAPGNGQLVAVLSPTKKVELSTVHVAALEDELDRLANASDRTSFITVDGSEYRVVVEHPVNQAGTWTVVAARNAQAERIVVNSLTETLAVTGLVILIAFGIASWVLSTAALRPVTRMRREAERLSASAGRAVLPVGPAQDELSSLATTLNAFLDGTRQATERERQMVSDASHELRTPLAILTTQLDLASLDGDDAAALRQHIERAKQSVARLSRLANDLLTLSKTEESGRGPTDLPARTFTWSELGDEVMAAVDRVRLIAGAKNITVDFDLEAPIAVGGSGPGIGAGTVEPRYRLDTSGIAQLVTNIAGNAVAALQEGGGILVTWRADHGRGTLQITDNGPGVPDSFVPVAFDRFTRPDQARRPRPESEQHTFPGGSGLGLAIVRAIAERAGGTASLRNLRAGGLEVTVTVPEVRPDTK
jgi:signal transduction histidine kinase